MKPKTRAKRQREIEAGLDELDMWMRDLIRGGLATLQDKTDEFYENPARRLIDAKAPALAERVRGLAAIPDMGEGWIDALLTEFAQLHLIIEGFRRFDQLPHPRQADLRAAVGWYVRATELADEPVIDDAWWVVGTKYTQQDKLNVRRVWLYGQASQRFALLLDFAHGASNFDRSYRIGEVLQAGIVFYPGMYPLRGVLRSAVALPDAAIPPLAAYPSLKASIDGYVQAIAQNPWLANFPAAYEQVIPVKNGGSWQIVDANRDALPLAGGFQADWELFAISGGGPMWLFGEWDGETVFPLSVVQNGTLSGLGGWI